MTLSKIITIANQKGGVGKTTVSVSLLGSLAERGFNVLGVDLDPQGSLGFSAGLDIESNHTILDVLKGDVPIREALVRSEIGDFLLSNILLSGADREFTGQGREFLLKRALSEVADDYDFIIVDTPPALGFATTNAYAAADGVIIPTKANILEVLAVSQIRETVREIQSSLNPSLRVYGILINQFDGRFILSREVSEMMQSLAQEMDTKVFKARIRTSVAVAEAPAHGETVMTYDRSVNAAQDFRAFTTELLKTI